MTDTNYSNNLALLTNTPTYVESLLPSLKQAARGIGLYVNVNKIEHMCSKQKGAISILKWQASQISGPVSAAASHIKVVSIYIGPIRLLITTNNNVVFFFASGLKIVYYIATINSQSQCLAKERKKYFASLLI